MVKIGELKFEKNVKSEDIISILEEIQKYYGIITLENGSFEIENYK